MPNNTTEKYRGKSLHFFFAKKYALHAMKRISAPPCNTKPSEDNAAAQCSHQTLRRIHQSSYAICITSTLDLNCQMIEKKKYGELNAKAACTAKMVRQVGQIAICHRCAVARCMGKKIK